MVMIACGSLAQKCTLITGAEQSDITDSARVRPMEQELMAAVRGEQSVYSTGDSLAVAELLLLAHDASRSTSL